MEFPADVRWVLLKMQMLIIDVTVFGPVECIGLGSFVTELELWLVTPIAIVALIVSLSILKQFVLLHAHHELGAWARSQARLSKAVLVPRWVGAFLPRLRGRASQYEGSASTSMVFRHAWLDAMPLVLFVTFIFSPVAYSRAFLAFDCEQFDDGSSYLVADYRVDCSSSEYHDVRELAWVNILLYAVAVPACYAVLLQRASKQIVADEDASLAHALAFLYRDFRPARGTIFYELVEVEKKVVLSGVMVLFHRGQMLQLIVAIVLALAFLFLQAEVKPYRSSQDNFLATCSSLALVLLFLGAIVYKVDVISDELGDALSDHIRRLLFMNTAITTAVMVGILLICFLLGGLMMIHDMTMHARREWHERVARVEAMQSRGRMAHPPTCEWPLGGGHDYACFLSHCALAHPPQPQPPRTHIQLICNAYRDVCPRGASGR